MAPINKPPQVALCHLLLPNEPQTSRHSAPILIRSRLLVIVRAHLWPVVGAPQMITFWASFSPQLNGNKLKHATLANRHSSAAHSSSSSSRRFASPKYCCSSPETCLTLSNFVQFYPTLSNFSPPSKWSPEFGKDLEENIFFQIFQNGTFGNRTER